MIHITSSQLERVVDLPIVFLLKGELHRLVQLKEKLHGKTFAEGFDLLSLLHNNPSTLMYSHHVERWAINFWLSPAHEFDLIAAHAGEVTHANA